MFRKKDLFFSFDRHTSSMPLTPSCCLQLRNPSMTHRQPNSTAVAAVLPVTVPNRLASPAECFWSLVARRSSSETERTPELKLVVSELFDEPQCCAKLTAIVLCPIVHCTSLPRVVMLVIHCSMLSFTDLPACVFWFWLSYLIFMF